MGGRFAQVASVFIAHILGLAAIEGIALLIRGEGGEGLSGHGV